MNHESMTKIVDGANGVIRSTARELGAAEYTRDKYKSALQRIEAALQQPHGMKIKLRLINRIISETLP